MIEIFLGSIGLLLIIEGLLYAVFPNRMKSLIIKMTEISNETLKWGGIASALLGLMIMWTVLS
mgnify:FL=1|tara:strand:+ start:560 stop:748 length:189 start_codon:yes stop_codon:yes gene_type:complete